LRSWLRYWQAVRDGRQPPNPGDTRSMAPARTRMISSEIDVRETKRVAGPDRDKSWRGI
jgi:hypothetical protein